MSHFNIDPKVETQIQKFKNRMILNLHEMFILDWIHECRQSSLGGFPVWSIVLGFVSHVLLVSLLLSTTFTLWSSFDVLFFSANQKLKMFCTHTLHRW